MNFPIASPVVEAGAKQEETALISLPTYPHVTAARQGYVVERLSSALGMP